MNELKTLGCSIYIVCTYCTYWFTNYVSPIKKILILSCRFPYIVTCYHVYMYVNKSFRAKLIIKCVIYTHTHTHVCISIQYIAILYQGQNFNELYGITTNIDVYTFDLSK